jgi:hypothetical protein
MFYGISFKNQCRISIFFASAAVFCESKVPSYKVIRERLYFFYFSSGVPISNFQFISVGFLSCICRREVFIGDKLIMNG